MIKSYKLFLESKDEVSAICKRYNIINWSINPDTGLVDVDCDVYIHQKNLTKLPLNFGKVSGDFYCGQNKLITLEGSPKEVGGSFYCHRNKLTSLEGCPKEVGGDFNCSHNHLTNLKWCPKEVGRDFWCDNNRLVSLEGLVKANFFNAEINPIPNLTTIGRNMIDKKISFLEAVILNIAQIPDNELLLVMSTMNPQFILDRNDFKLFNFLRTHLPEKYKEVMSLRNVDLSADLGELGF